ncbi:MAG TPA: 16S rRNA (guanine(966)-N(2))-methyltransferase RsmD [Candidatus Limnocylindrales bacterium]|jgi:16S rRNA (guanine(966)-N(2))-methyltransferase RsmD|nr:16S rRNA (guanine(966)-N(2))-methyltransferase RsmD [Candidatus Limnocylindrales bacterium]
MADAGRVIAGTARGVRLAAPGEGTRPLTDRVKQTLFAILEPRLEDAVVADLFAGSGAGAIEALSRGAARAVLVEKDGGACRTIAENLRRTRLEDRARVVRRDVTAWLGDPEGATAGGPFDLVLVDPPYADTEALIRTLERIGEHLTPDAVVVAKHFWRDAPPPRVGMLAAERGRRFGETALTFYRRATEATEAHSGEADEA